MSTAKPVRQIVTIVMNILIFVAVLLVVRVVVLFFGALASLSLADVLIAVSDYLVIPFGIEAIKTPYGGVFDVDAALTIGTLIIAEWALSVSRNRA